MDVDICGLTSIDKCRYLASLFAANQAREHCLPFAVGDTLHPPVRIFYMSRSSRCLARPAAPGQFVDLERTGVSRWGCGFPYRPAPTARLPTESR
jgi:hypothetical protein